jgi:hypothetical protein
MFVIEALTRLWIPLVVDPGDPVARPVTAHHRASHFLTPCAAEQVRVSLTDVRVGRRRVTEPMPTSRVRECPCRLETFSPPRSGIATDPLPLFTHVEQE